MQFSPESQILILNAVVLAIAYGGIYPSLQHKTLNKIMAIDLLLSCLVVAVAGALFWGRNISFDLLVAQVNWAVFSVVSLSVMEVPLFFVFARKYGIDLTGGDDR
jgi:energy-converting hydrogenase Eha subunit C